MVILGDETIANEYTTRITAYSDERLVSFSYRGKVNPITMTEDEILLTGKCLVMTNDHIRAFMSRKNMSTERKQKGFDTKLLIDYMVV